MLKFLKRKDKKKSNEPEYEIINGMWDKTKRTKAGMRHLITLLSLVVIFVLGVMLYGYKSHDYKMYQMNNTTKIGSDLQFTKSEATVRIDDVWTDENRDVTVVKLGYDNKARDLLSTKGKNYNLYMVTDGDKPPVKLKYGMLGTEGDGFLFIKGQLDKKAYQLYIANTVELTTGEGISSGTETDEDSTTDGESASQDSIEKSLAKTSDEDVDDNGIMLFNNNNKDNEPKVDNINFRINPYSETTKVHKGSFLNKDGSINYSKVVSATSIDSAIKNIDKKIDKKNENLKKLHVSLDEYKDRLKTNKGDASAKANIEEVNEAIKVEEEQLQNLKSSKERYEKADFDKSSFGDMQEKFKIDVK